MLKFREESTYEEDERVTFEINLLKRIWIWVFNGGNRVYVWWTGAGGIPNRK